MGVLKENKFRRTNKNSLGQIRNKVRYFRIDLQNLSLGQYRLLRRMFKDQNILQEIQRKKKTIKKPICDNNAIHILKNIIPFCIRQFECYLKTEEPKRQNIIDLIENVRNSKSNANQNQKKIQKLEIKELKEFIQNQEFVQKFSAFLRSQHYEEKYIDQNKRIKEERKQSYKIASKMVLEELNNPARQKFQRFISKKNNLEKLFFTEEQYLDQQKEHDFQIESEFIAIRKDNIDNYFNFFEEKQVFVESD
ncbi:unnamed protein product [Paramecium sonneborni]|uniref:Uncharacterized protein n=1 Tax=Paramecium sonneborni TaxID=65129 RepID=A0A8S1LVP8_9CILI|nr:unnamed protein product [Paramecium sonneborni]